MHSEIEGELGSVLVERAIGSGERDENKLTNLVFFDRHPGRGGRPISKSEPGYQALASEWLAIRDQIVRPALRSTTPGGQSGAGPLTLVGTQLPGGSRPARQYGIPEAIQALVWVGEQWRRAHPTVQFHVGDISKRGGGRFPPHKSHRAGLDVDVSLRKGKKRICVTDPNYAVDRPLVQELVGIIRANPSLRVREIGFLDGSMKGVSPWPRHTCHLHIRFCRPSQYRSALDLTKVYRSGEYTPPFDC